MVPKIRGEIVWRTRRACRKKANALFITALFVIGTLFNIAHATTLKVCYDQWAPMTIFPTATSSRRGVIIDMVEQIYTAQGYTIKYYEVPLARGLEMVADGTCDMLPEYLISDSAEQLFDFATQETFAYKSAFVVRNADDWRYQGVQSIKGKRIATGPGWDYSSMSADYQGFIDDPNNASMVEVIAGNDDVIERIFRMIKENRVDVYADNELVLQHVLNQLNLNHELKIVRPGLEKKLIEYPIFSKTIPAEKRQKLITIWEQGRVSLKGEKEQLLLKKYNVSL